MRRSMKSTTTTVRAAFAALARTVATVVRTGKARLESRRNDR